MKTEGVFMNYDRMVSIKQSRKLALASAIIMALSASTSVSVMAGDLPMDIQEAHQESRILTTYELSPTLRTYDIKVEVNEDTAILTGKVDEEVNRELAKQIALGVSGIDKVENRIEIVSDYEPVTLSDNRTYGDIVADASITAAVKSKLLWNQNTQGLAADVETMAGNVSLKGTANSAAASELAGELALNTHGVVSVDNNLIVDESMSTPGEKARETTDEIGQTFSDSWITTKVKSTLMYSSNVNSSRITVATKDGVVNLTGVVNSAAERDLAVALARNIKGVTKVDNQNLSHL